MAKISRRTFIQSVGASVAAPAIIKALKQPKQLPIAFSTLGCPKWEWKTILDQATTLGYAALELRGIQGEMDLTKRPEFSAGRIKQTLQDLKALNLHLSDLGASSKMHEADPAKRAAQMDEGKRFIDLAHRLNAPYIRVFGDKYVKGEEKQVTIDRVIAGLRELGQHAQGSKVSVLLEAHGDFTDSPTLLKILQGANLPTVALLWDAHHTFAAGKEDPAHTYKHLRQYVRHTHLKDSKPKGDGVQYVLTGEGTVPIRETVRVLVAGGYRGYYSFEWEKAWHPEIEDPEIAIPHFAKMIRTYLAEAGFKS